jgi:hypothetical protein
VKKLGKAIADLDKNSESYKLTVASGWNQSIFGRRGYPRISVGRCEENSP